MTDAPRIAVVGGGIAGLTIAWELARAGAGVTVVSDDHPSTSSVAAGMLAPMPESTGSGVMLRLGSAGLRHYPVFLAGLADDTPLDAGFRRSGVLRLAGDDAETSRLRETVGSYEAAGMPSRWLDRRSLRRLIPALPDGVRGGLLSFDEAQVQPGWLLAALRAAAARRGVRFVQGTVVALEPAIRLAGGPDLAADVAVLAAGSWSAGLVGGAVPVRPVKGQLLVFRDVPGPEHILYAGHDYVVAKPDGTVLVGGTVEEAGFSLQPDGLAEGLREMLPGLWPALAGAPAEARAGLRPGTPDGLPIHGFLPALPRVYAFTGHFRNGFLLAPLGARLAAREILTGEPEELFAPLRPQRFEMRSA